MVRGLLTTLCFSLLISLGLGYAHYQQQIPNGDRVPNPAIDNLVWYGVGHINSDGGLARNSFGLDFQANGHVSNIVIVM